MSDFTAQFPALRGPLSLLLRGAGALPRTTPTEAEMRALHDLPDYLLHDMGLTRADLPPRLESDKRAQATRLELRGFLGFR